MGELSIRIFTIYLLGIAIYAYYMKIVISNNYYNLITYIMMDKPELSYEEAERIIKILYYSSCILWPIKILLDILLLFRRK